VLVEVSDYACQFCARFVRDTYPEIDRQFIDQGRLTYAVLTFSLNPATDTWGYGLAAECAGEQKRFWKMRSFLFSLPQRDSSIDVRGLASEAGLERTAFDECVRNTASSERLHLDRKEALRLGVKSTPTFFVGRLSGDGSVSLKWRLLGAQPFEVFRRALERVIDN
jgi:protein-disulfide isomerase